MALVTFTDSSGRGWRAWNVERARPEPGKTDFLDEPFRDGWLVFESQDGQERRRLTRYPDQWDSLAPRELEQLCHSAALATRLGTAATTRADLQVDRDAPDAPTPNG